jgi:hypothetical protein
VNDRLDAAFDRIDRKIAVLKLLLGIGSAPDCVKRYHSFAWEPAEGPRWSVLLET